MMRDKYEINKIQENEFESLNDLLRKEIVADLKEMETKSIRNE